MQQLKKPLRTCPVCGLQAYTEEDLKRFKKDRTCLYGRNNLCNKCNREYVKEKKRRTAEFIRVFRERSPDGIIRCYFCGKPILKMKGVEGGALHIHSLDDDHENWNPENKVPAHAACHIGYHSYRDGNPNWKGDEASVSAKRKRVRWD